MSTGGANFTLNLVMEQVGASSPRWNNRQGVVSPYKRRDTNDVLVGILMLGINSSIMKPDVFQGQAPREDLWTAVHAQLDH